MALIESRTGYTTVNQWCTDIYPPNDPALGVYADLYGVFDMSNLAMIMSTHDNTPLGGNTRFRDFKGGLVDKVEFPYTMVFQDDAAQTHPNSFREFYDAFTGTADSGATSPERYFRILSPGGLDFDFAAIISGINITNPLDGIIKFEATITVKGDITYSPPD